MTNSTEFEFDVFISYNQHDEPWAKQLATRLEQEDWQGGKLKVFFAPWDIRPGESIPGKLEYALPRSRKVCLIMTPDSASSEWVKIERYVTQHIDITERQSRLVPLYRRASEIPPFLQHINRIDFQDDAKFENGYRILLATIKDEPLPRGEQKTSTVVATPVPIPRPPVVGFVSRRDRQGRDIVERLKEELAPNKNQLVALWGPGGAGKTTLAAEATRALTTLFDHRIAWVSPLLRADMTFLTFLDEIASQLGRPDLRTLAPEEKENQVSALIAAAPTLIVLDNFETITPEEEQTKCVAYLAQNASCPALITTRTRIDEAFNVPLAAMSIEEAREFLTRLVEQTRIPAKFDKLDRDDLIQKCEANPLVLQWVVGQIDRALPLMTVLGYLAQGKGDAAKRVFTRSFELPQLGADGRAVLLALSLFVPSASREALGQVAGLGADLGRLDQALEHLASLWMIEDADDGERLMLQGLTRELAKARLTTESLANELRQRFVKYFLEYSQAHAEPTPEDYEALETEKDNLLSAMDVAFDMQDWSTVQGIAYKLAVPVGGMLSVHGYWDEAIRRNQQALRAARALSSEMDISYFAHNSAVIHQNRGETEEARRLYDESRAIKKRLGDQRGIAATLHQLAMLAQDQGKLDEARRLHNESLEIEKRLSNQSGIAVSLHELATLAYVQGELDEARQLYNESLEIEKRLGNQSGIAITLHNLAAVAQGQGELEEARRLYNESLEIKKRLGDQSGIAYSLHQLGRLAEEEGNVAGAAQLFSEALAIFEKLKSPNAEIARRNLERVKGKSS